MRLWQLIEALVRNAAMFSADEMPIDLAIGPGADLLTIEVRDGGPGLKEDEWGRVWDAFYRSPGHAHLPGLGGVEHGVRDARHIYQTARRGSLEYLAALKRLRIECGLRAVDKDPVIAWVATLGVTFLAAFLRLWELGRPRAFLDNLRSVWHAADVLGGTAACPPQYLTWPADAGRR